MKDKFGSERNKKNVNQKGIKKVIESLCSSFILRSIISWISNNTNKILIHPPIYSIKLGANPREGGDISRFITIVPKVFLFVGLRTSETFIESLI